MSKPWYAAFTEDGSRWTAGPESLNDALDRAAFFETLGKGRVSFGQTKPGGARTLPFVMPIENVHKLLAAGGHKPPSQGGYQNLKSYRKRNANPRDRFSTAPRKKAAAWRVHPDGRGDRMYANGVSADVYKTSISPALWQSVVYGLTGGPQRSPIMGSSQEVRDWADAKARTYRVLNPSRERGAEIAHALFGGPKRKVTKRFLKDEKVGWNGFAVKVVKYGKDQTVIRGTGVSERAVPTSSIEDIPNWEWQNRWDKQWEGKKANPKRNPTVPKAGSTIQIPWAYDFANGYIELRVKHVRGRTVEGTVTKATGEAAHENAVGDVISTEFAGYRAVKANPSGDDWRVIASDKDHARMARAKAAGHRVSLWHGEGKSLYKIIRVKGPKRNPSSHIGDIIRVRHTPSADAPAVYTPFENNYRVLDVSNDPSRARRPIKVASTTNKHGQKGAVSWISVDQIVKVVRRAK